MQNFCPAEEVVHQGVKAKVLIKEGIFLENGEIADSGRVYGADREIFIYPILGMRDVDLGENGFIMNIFVDPVVKGYSDDQGNFEAELPAGNYSLVIKERDMYYSGIPTDNGNFTPIEIKSGSYTEFSFVVDYKARYKSED